LPAVHRIGRPDRERPGRDIVDADGCGHRPDQRHVIGDHAAVGHRRRRGIGVLHRTDRAVGDSGRQVRDIGIGREQLAAIDRLGRGRAERAWREIGDRRARGTCQRHPVARRAVVQHGRAGDRADLRGDACKLAGVDGIGGRDARGDIGQLSLCTGRADRHLARRILWRCQSQRGVPCLRPPRRNAPGA
jgi:hypothetical protein